MKTKLLSLPEALLVYNKMPNYLKIPSINPNYIICDSKRDKNIELNFWYAEKGSKFFLYSFYKNFIKEFNIFDIESPYGYGGPISNSKEKQFIKEVAENFSQWCNQNNIIVEFLRFHPLINHINFYWGTKKYNRKTICMDLDSEITTQYRPRRQKDLKEIKKYNYTLNKATTIDEKIKFKHIYIENMNNINAKEFYFFNNEYFDCLFENDICDIWFVKYNNVIIATTSILKNKYSRCVEYHLSARVKYEKKFKEINKNVFTYSQVYMLNALASYYKDNKYKLFYLGGGRSSDPKDSLFFFKNGFSNTLIDFEIAYHIHDKKKYMEIKKHLSTNFNINNIQFYR